MPKASRIGPARKTPSGLTSAQKTICVVITFGRSAAGTRSIEIACRLGLTRPFAIPDTQSAAASTAGGTGIHNSQSGSAWPMMQTEIRLRPS